MQIPKFPLPLDKPNVVGTFYSDKEKISLESYSEIDAIELRLDLLEKIPSLTEFNKKPFIITARHPEEGGNRNLNTTERLQLLKEAIPLAAFIDLELRFWNEYSPFVLPYARKAHIGVIASFHDFSGTPPLPELIEEAHLAQKLGADIFKVATYLNGPSDLACLLQLQATIRTPLSVMGMGPLGIASRLILARCGSVLNYGCLGSPLVQGQWPAHKLAEILKMLNC